MNIKHKKITYTICIIIILALLAFTVNIWWVTSARYTGRVISRVMVTSARFYRNNLENAVENSRFVYRTRKISQYLHGLFETKPIINEYESVKNIQSVIISPEIVTAKRGQRVLFNAKVIGVDSPPQQNVFWEVFGGLESTYISDIGQMQVHKHETTDSLVVKAISIVDTTKTAIAVVMVENPVVIKYGPAGGIIFYDKGKYTDGWRYLEFAPADSEFKATWGLEYVKCPDTSEAIGSGKANTAKIIKLLDANGEKEKAAQKCALLTINGYNDWFLPSKGELNELYKYIADVGNVDELGLYMYWSSSASDDDFELYEVWSHHYEFPTSYRAWQQDFSFGEQRQIRRATGCMVRAIRAY